MEAPGPIPADTHPVFAGRTPWSAGAATVFTLFALAAAIFVAWLAQPINATLGSLIVRRKDPTGIPSNGVVETMLTMLVLQAVIVALVWWGTGRFGGDRRRLLSLMPGLPISTFLTGLAGMIAVLLPLNLVIYYFWPSQFATNMEIFWVFARSPALWLAALVFAVGAPLSEELLFRGFLLPALCKTRYGFTGAALIATSGWTLLHAYTFLGMLEVFLIGLYFSWLMWRYANLWLPLALHALYNGLQLLVLAWWPLQ